MSEQYYMPVRVITGRDCIIKNTSILKKIGSKALILCGYTSADKNGAIADVCMALEASDREYDIYRGVLPNPTVEQVMEIAEFSRNQGCTGIIAIGGGSVIDAAKAAAVLAANTLTEDELFTQKEFDYVLPLIAVPTTAGTGSEVTQYAIITQVSKQTKSFVISDRLFPQVAFLDGKYMKQLPIDITVHTAIDALSHAMEGYLAVRATAMGKQLATESMRLLAPILKKLQVLMQLQGLKKLQSLQKLQAEIELTLADRDQLLYAAMLAGIVISQSGTTAVHALGYSLTYFKHIEHGRANGLLLPAYLAVMQQARNEDVTCMFAALGISSLGEFKDLCSSLVTSETLTEEEVVTFSKIAIQAGNIQNTSPKPTLHVLQEMLLAASVSGE